MSPSTSCQLPFSIFTVVLKLHYDVYIHSKVYLRAVLTQVGVD